MAILKIASFNVKDDSKDDKEEKAKILTNIIKKEKIDILGTQELTKEYEKTLKTKLKDYKYYGKYRFGNKIFSKLKYNENNIIITNRRVIFNKTIWLPWLANNFKDLKNSIIKKSITPRIATMIIISDKEIGKIRVINTHLDYKIKSIKQRQLTKLKKIIFKYEKKYPVILSGDFNMELDDKDFLKFVNDLKKNRMKKIDIKENSYGPLGDKGRKIDHIFIPEEWKVVEYGIMDNRGISDHRPIYVTVEVNKKQYQAKYIEKIKQVLKIK